MLDFYGGILSILPGPDIGVFSSKSSYQSSEVNEVYSPPYYLFDEGVTFINVYQVDFPQYLGEVAVLKRGEPQGNRTIVGWIYIKKRTWIKGEIKRIMESEAAKYGADTVILDYKKPYYTASNHFFGSAKALKSNKETSDNP